MAKAKIKIGIVGIGAVGSSLRKYFSKKGFKKGVNLFCYDNDPRKNFNDDTSKANIVFICVPTPSRKDGSCDIGFVDSAIKQNQDENKVIVVKSTVEPGTVAKLQKKYSCPLIFNPEFLTESQAWEDFVKPDRQIVGYTEKSKSQTRDVLGILPQAFFSSPGYVDTYNSVSLNSSEAELGKYAGNVFGSLKVVYGNILADFCRALSQILAKEGINEEVDYENVRKAISYDGRIGGAWLDVYHGNYRGFGGACFPKDTAAFISFGQKLEKKLPKDNPDKKLIKSGLKFLKAAWDYNKELLKSQNLTIEQVSVHNRKSVKQNKN
jgi:nucleotide sugar dehydrogenase